MTDLTKKYKKGKLDLDHSYYLKLKDGRIEIQLYVGGFIMEEDNEVVEVLAEVPSYKEYQALLSDQLAKNEGVEINAELEAEDERLRQEIKEWQKMARRILPALIPVQEDMATLIKTLLKVSPEHREWLETNFKEYL